MDSAMTDLEYDVLDELYFVISFPQLLASLELEEEVLKEALHTLINKQWVKCFENRAEELGANEIDFANQFRKYFYLATKAGLLAHHGK